MRRVAATVVLMVLVAAAPARADRASLYRGPAPRPGPDALYAGPATAPQLTNAAPFRAEPILVSGATAYRDGEFLYQDFLYDDHGARLGADPGDPRASAQSFSQPNGTYTYPTDPAYAGNAADLVELRVKPVAGATLFRLTLNTLQDADRVAATIAIGSSATPRPFPHGANATAPAQLFLTVHGTTADLRDALTGLPVAGGTPTASVDPARRQITVSVPHAAWDPGTATVRLAAGVGLWDRANARYLIPGPAATPTTPGGAGADPVAPAFFNVAFRTAEPLPQVNDPTVLTDPRWWRDAQQGNALRTGDLSPFFANVDFGKLARGEDDESGVPATGPLDRILASHYEPAQGIDFTHTCQSSAGCSGELRGRLQPYALYVPRRPPPGGRYGLQLLLHSLGANYNQFTGTRNQSQFGERPGSYIVMTPEGRGPDGWYYDHAGADTFEVWADVARRYKLDAGRTDIAGYSMGGYGTYKFATQFPDLFARGQPTVGPPGLGIWVPPSPPQPGGERSNTFRQLASLRNIPFLIWDAAQDELVPTAGAQRQAQGFDDLGYRYEFDLFDVAEHLTLAVNDQYAPAAAFLGNPRVDRNPAHVTYVRNPTMDFASDGTTADHAYWLSGVHLRDASGDAPLARADARSHGFGRGDPRPGATQRGEGALAGGNLGTLPYTFQRKAWGRVPRTARADMLDLTVRNVGEITVHPKRARLTCHAALRVDSDGPVVVHFAGCGRTQRVSGGSGCHAIRSLRVPRRTFGGRRHRRLRVLARVGVCAHGRLELRRGGRTLRHRTVARSRTWRVRPAGLRAGRYRVRLVAHAGGRTVRRSVRVRLLAAGAARRPSFTG
jgi:dienelactone hydrolase